MVGMCNLQHDDAIQSAHDRSRYFHRRLFVAASLVFAISATPRSFAQAGADQTKPASSKKPVFETAATIQPSFSWASGTQNQTIYGGSGLLSAAKSESFCDPAMQQLGIAATASDSKTAKSAKAGGGAPSYIYTNDVKLDAMTGLGSRARPKDGSLPWTAHFVAVDADFFENNSLGIGLQKSFAAQYQFDLGCKLNRASPDLPKRFFASFGVGAGYMNQRLYKTVGSVNGAILPISAQFSYLIGGDKKSDTTADKSRDTAGDKSKSDQKGPPKLIWSTSLGYVPVLNNNQAYQLSGIMSVQIPTQIRWLTISLSDTDLYANNAPVGHKRNYNNGTISLQFSFPPKPKTPPKDAGACYGGDKLQRIYCFEGVTSDACTGTNIFREDGKCSSAGFVPADEVK